GSGTAPPVGATKPGIPADRSNRRTTSGVSRIAGQAGTQATDPTPTSGQNPGSRAEAHIHILPAEYLRLAAIRDWRRVEHRSSSSGSGRDQLDCPGSAGG